MYIAFRAFWNIDVTLTVFHLYEKNLKKCDTCDTLGVALHEYAFWKVGRSFSSSPVFVQGALAQKRDAVCNVIKLRPFTSLDFCVEK